MKKKQENCKYIHMKTTHMDSISHNTTKHEQNFLNDDDNEYDEPKLDSLAILKFLILKAIKGSEKFRKLAQTIMCFVMVM